MQRCPSSSSPLLLAALLALAACASSGSRQPSAATFPTPAEQRTVEQAPLPPALAERGSARDVWHLRSALNVAALGCTRAGDAQITSRYNAMLKAHATLLTQAYLAEENRYRAEHGARWQAVQDREATQLYNRYANHPEQSRFCREAAAIAADALRVSSDDLPRFAAAALPRIEAPAFVPRPAPAIARAPTKTPVRATAKAPARKG